MGNTVFYRQLQQDASKIGWKEIFSDYKKKHTHEDFEYALAAGTALNTSSEEYMLQRWRKPWVFYPLLKWGLALMALLYVVYFFCYNIIGGMSNSGSNMTVMIPPLIPPIILLVLFWEMNIPRNISIYELLAMWLVGGFISFAVVSLLFVPFPDSLPASIGAPLREEPAKLVASIIIILFFGRKKKIYGITGFVIGAAVGAGFGAFESVSYALKYASEGLLSIHLMRFISALSGGHLLYCAPYAAAIALHMKDNKITVGSIFNIDFILSFLIVCIHHGIWDMPYDFGMIGNTIIEVVLGILEWSIGLFMLRKCLNQAVEIGAKASGGVALEHGAGVGYTMAIPSGAGQEAGTGAVQGQGNTGAAQTMAQSRSASIRVICSAGELQGMQWQSDGHDILLVGRDGSCGLRFSSNAKGVSSRHCSIQYTQFGWTIKDLGSTYGTFVSGSQKVLPGTEVRLKQGDTISLGGNENVLSVELN